MSTTDLPMDLRLPPARARQFAAETLAAYPVLAEKLEGDDLEASEEERALAHSDGDPHLQTALEAAFDIASDGDKAAGRRERARPVSPKNPAPQRRAFGRRSTQTEA